MKIETVAIETLLLDPANVRLHDARNIAAIKASLARFGQQKPIVVNAQNVVVAGNGTLIASKELGRTEINIVRSELAGAEAIAFAIADNRTAELAAWDDPALAQQLAALQIDDEELAAAAGFSEQEIERLSLANKEIIEDEVPEPPVVSITKPGDLWILGEHRLLCGDSTKAEDVARLMDGAKADLCFTSPPYALGKSFALSGNKGMSVTGNAYDQYRDDSASWPALMDGWWQQSLAAVSTAWLVNVQPLAGNKRELMRWIADRVDRLIDIITWDKGHAQPPMAQGVLASRYEWIIAMGKDGASRAFPMSTWRGTMQSVYEAPPQRSHEHSDIHAATMPVHVPVWVIGSLCDQSSSVYEPFCGTGTTLIAAEQLGRKCYGMEISPQYCDVIVKRWEQFTGKKATLATSESPSAAT